METNKLDQLIYLKSLMMLSRVVKKTKNKEISLKRNKKLNKLKKKKNLKRKLKRRMMIFSEMMMTQPLQQNQLLLSQRKKRKRKLLLNQSLFSTLKYMIKKQICKSSSKKLKVSPLTVLSGTQNLKLSQLLLA